MRLASIYSFGNANVPVNLAKARALQERACSGGVGKACYFLASAHELGRGAPKDPDKASALIAQGTPRIIAACEGGEAESCSILADMYMIGKGVEKSEAKEQATRARATEMYGRECDAGDASSCFMYGGDLVSAKKGEAAAKVLTRGCDAGDAASCSLLGGMYDEGFGVKADPARAKALWTKACKGGISAACSRL